MNICLVSANDVMEHFAFPGNIDFVADDQGAFSCIIYERVSCSDFITNHKLCVTAGGFELQT